MLPSYALDRATLEQASFEATQYLYLGDTEGLCRVLGKYKMYVDTRDTGIAPHLSLEGYWESWVTVAVARMVRPGWRCVDIGANFGYYTMLLADAVGPEGYVAAIEPNPELAELLTKSIGLNGFGGFTKVVQKAASDQSGTDVDLAVDRTILGGGSLFKMSREHDVTFRVQTVTVDDITQAWPAVDFIKIDAESAEEKIWRGMSRTIEKNPGLKVLMEFNPGRYSDPSSFLGEIRQAGFSVGLVGFDSLVTAANEGALIGHQIEHMLMLES